MHEPPSQFRHIVTPGTLLRLAIDGPADQAKAAREQLVLLYRKAITSYLGALLQREEDAYDVAMTVLLDLMQGKFRSYQQSKGRFRYYLQTAVRNAARDHFRKRGGKREVPMPEDDVFEDGRASDAFNERWRDLIVRRALERIEEHQAKHPNNFYHDVLRLRQEHPDEGWQELTRRLNGASGRSFNEAAVRQQCSRARHLLAQFVLKEVENTLDDPTPDEVEDELRELRLIVFIEDFLPPDWKEKGRLAEPE